MVVRSKHCFDVRPKSKQETERAAYMRAEVGRDIELMGAQECGGVSTEDGWGRRCELVVERYSLRGGGSSHGSHGEAQTHNNNNNLRLLLYTKMSEPTPQNARTIMLWKEKDDVVKSGFARSCNWSRISGNPTRKGKWKSDGLSNRLMLPVLIVDYWIGLVLRKHPDFDDSRRMGFHVVRPFVGSRGRMCVCLFRSSDYVDERVWVLQGKGRAGLSLDGLGRCSSPSSVRWITRANVCGWIIGCSDFFSEIS